MDSAVCPQQRHGLAHKEYIRWGQDRVIPTLLGILDEPILGCLDTEIHVTTVGYDLWHGEWYRWALTGFIMPEIEIFKGPRLPLPRLKGLVSRKKTGGAAALTCLSSLPAFLVTTAMDEPQWLVCFRQFPIDWQSSCSRTIEVKGHCWL